MSAFDSSGFRYAIENRDANKLASYYADDATLQVIDRSRMPSNPLVMNGKAAVSAYFDDICGRAMTHSIESLIENGDKAAYSETCLYPDGTRVYCGAFLDLVDGKIVRQSQVQAWDE